jgi:probable blue pigment (indigoidine) exporter
MLFVAIMNICFAAALPLLKVALGYTTPAMMVTMRMLLGGVVLIAYVVAREGMPTWRTLPWRLIAHVALFEVYILCLGEAWALERMSSAKASVIWSLLPLLTACVVRIFQGTHISYVQWLAMGIAMAGYSLTIDLHDIVGGGYGIPEIVMMGAVCSAAYGYIVLERLAYEMQSVALSSGLMMLVGGLGSLITVFIGHGGEPLTTAVTHPALWMIMACIVLLENVIGLTLQTLLMRRYSATFLAISMFITPLCGVLIGVWFLGEPWYHRYEIALIATFSGMLLFYQEEIRQSIAQRMHQKT